MLGGERACPPEDFGGAFQYMQALNGEIAWDHPGYDPEAFDAEQQQHWTHGMPLINFLYPILNFCFVYLFTYLFIYLSIYLFSIIFLVSDRFFSLLFFFFSLSLLYTSLPSLSHLLIVNSSLPSFLPPSIPSPLFFTSPHPSFHFPFSFSSLTSSSTL